MRSLAVVAVLATTPALAQPATATATAPDGEARNYERPPEDAYVHGSFVVRGVGVGLSWIVRVVVAPFRGLNYLEARWKLITRARRLFVNDANTAGIVPTLKFNSDFGVTYGARAFIDNYFGANEEVAATAQTGGAVVEAFEGRFDLKKLGGAPIYVRSRVRYEENDNLFFAGIGNAGSMTKTRFSQDRFLTTLASGVQIGGDGGARLRIGAGAIYNDRSFGAAGGSSTDPSIETVYDTASIPGFDAGYRTLELDGEIELDTRDQIGAPQHGGTVRAFGGGASLVGHTDYAHYGAEGTYYLTPWWPRRTLVGRVALDAVRDKDGDIPFTELPRLGGAGLLRGYHTDEFRDDLAAVATIEYRYPIHEQLTGSVFVEAGKVAGTYSELAQDAPWHVGYGGGVLWHRPSTIKARLDIAYGDGLQIYLSTDVLDAFRKREREL